MTVVADFLKLPLHFLQLFSGAKSFEKNAILGNGFLNEKGLHVWRVALTQRLAAMRRRKLASLIEDRSNESS